LFCFFLHGRTCFCFSFLFFFISLWFVFCQKSSVRELEISFTPTHATCVSFRDKTNQNPLALFLILYIKKKKYSHTQQPSDLPPLLLLSTRPCRARSLCCCPRLTVTTLLLLCHPSIRPTVLFKVAIASALIPVTFLWLLLVKTIVAPMVVV
jgi:hypothetical protein